MMLSGAELSNAALFLWQLHEASLFALGSLSEQLCEAQVDFFDQNLIYTISVLLNSSLI
jgi:hypothetical protein